MPELKQPADAMIKCALCGLSTDMASIIYARQSGTVRGAFVVRLLVPDGWTIDARGVRCKRHA